MERSLSSLENPRRSSSPKQLAGPKERASAPPTPNERSGLYCQNSGNRRVGLPTPDNMYPDFLLQTELNECLSPCTHQFTTELLRLLYCGQHLSADAI